jgi:hypothetical protein
MFLAFVCKGFLTPIRFSCVCVFRLWGWAGINFFFRFSCCAPSLAPTCKLASIPIACGLDSAVLYLSVAFVMHLQGSVFVYTSLACCNFLP